MARICELLSEVIEANVSMETEVNGLTCNSNDKTDRGIYFALSGYSVDGREYIDDAVANGAVVVVSEVKPTQDVPYVLVANARRAMAEASASFYGNPAEKLTLIAVTGTNGKTSTVEIIKAIIEKSGERVATIGTLGIKFGGEVIDSGMTTPDPILLHKIFADLVGFGIKYVVMEASAHAIFLDKLYGLRFFAVVFTNLTQDHLDFFGTMSRYKAAKLRLFCGTFLGAGVAVVNADDACGQEILSARRTETISYGLDNPADIFAIETDEGGLNAGARSEGLKLVVNASDSLIYIDTRLSGRFNIYNILGAVGVARALGIGDKCIALAINNMEPVSGRFNMERGKGKTVIIDYAHTPDGLKNLLESARAICKGRLITVFGCGGNRDKTKRPIMGKVVGQLSDYSIITSDNPRFEVPEEIITDTENGIKQITMDYERMTDRAEAIERALMIADDKDIIVIAGKGSEPYMEIKGIKHPYSDKATVQKLYKSNGWTI